MNTGTVKLIPQRSFFPRPVAVRSNCRTLRLVAERPPLQGTPKQNHLLAALPAADYERLLPHLVPVEMAAGQVIDRPGCQVGKAYFPTGCVVSLCYEMEDGATVEISVVGSEGMVGTALIIGGEATPERASVQSPGKAFRLEGEVLKAEFSRGGALHQLLLRYTHALITQVAQMAVCHRRHGVEQQLCRRLLLGLDRQPSNELRMTQELLSNMLGVRREAVTKAAARLQSSGLIAYRRGHITVLDRPRLELASCECYTAVKREFDRLLPNMLAS
jgi:CRP-like cAMP-binding protein